MSLMMTSCDDNFMDYAPITSPTEETAFVSYDNFKTYVWGLYNIFGNNQMRQYIDVGNTGYLTMVDGDVKANCLYNCNSTNIQNSLAVG